MKSPPQACMKVAMLTSPLPEPAPGSPSGPRSQASQKAGESSAMSSP